MVKFIFMISSERKIGIRAVGVATAAGIAANIAPGIAHSADSQHLQPFQPSIRAVVDIINFKNSPTHQAFTRKSVLQTFVGSGDTYGEPSVRTWFRSLPNAHQDISVTVNGPYTLLTNAPGCDFSSTQVFAKLAKEA